MWTPANDNFANALTITGRAGSTTGSNVGATYQSGEPLKSFKSDATNSVWWIWTAPAAGEVTFTTKGSSTASGLSDTVMGIYTGTSLSSLSKVVENDNADGGRTSSCTFKAVSGKKYYIAVAGHGKREQGTIKLSWNQRPENDDFDYGNWISGVSGSTTGSNVGATYESGEPIHYGYASATNSVWWVWRAPSGGGLATFSTANTDFDTVMGIYRADGTPSLSSLQCVASNDDSSNNDSTSRCRFQAIGGSTYYIAVTGYGGKRGDIKLSWSLNPINDDFSYATVLSGSYGTSKGTTVRATRESGEPLPNFRSAATNTVWWTWIAPFSGSAVFHTTNSSLDTVMGIYTGTKVSDLAVVTVNDDANFSADIRGARCIFNATAGAKYHVVVSGLGNSKQGEVDLRWTLSPVEGTSKFSLTRDPNGGTYQGKTSAIVAANGLIYDGAAYWDIGVPTRAGYTFTGWFTAKSGGTKVYDANGKCVAGDYWTAGRRYVHPGDLVVYAQWILAAANNSLPGGTSKGKTARAATASRQALDVTAGTLDTTFAKAQTVVGALYGEDDELVGTVQVKAGSLNAKEGTVKLSAIATLIVDGKAKKVTAKAVTVDVGGALETTLTFKAPIGDMTFEMAADGTFTLTNDSYQVAEATIGGALKKGGAQGTFKLEGFYLAVDGEVQDELLPYKETFVIAGDKWSFTDCPSSLKLTYTAKTGQFKGSFKAYALEGAGKATKLKKYTVNVVGFVVDGVGYGEASCKKPAAGPWTVTVE